MKHTHCKLYIKNKLRAIYKDKNNIAYYRENNKYLPLNNKDINKNTCLRKSIQRGGGGKINKIFLRKTNRYYDIYIKTLNKTDIYMTEVFENLLKSYDFLNKCKTYIVDFLKKQNIDEDSYLSNLKKKTILKLLFKIIINNIFTNYFIEIYALCYRGNDELELFFGKFGQYLGDEEKPIIENKKNGIIKKIAKYSEDYKDNVDFIYKKTTKKYNIISADNEEEEENEEENNEEEYGELNNKMSLEQYEKLMVHQEKFNSFLRTSYWYKYTKTLITECIKSFENIVLDKDVHLKEILFSTLKQMIISFLSISIQNDIYIDVNNFSDDPESDIIVQTYKKFIESLATSDTAKTTTAFYEEFDKLEEVLAKVIKDEIEKATKTAKDVQVDVAPIMGASPVLQAPKVGGKGGKKAKKKIKGGAEEDVELFNKMEKKRLIMEKKKGEVIKHFEENYKYILNDLKSLTYISTKPVISSIIDKSINMEQKLLFIADAFILLIKNNIFLGYTDSYRYLVDKLMEHLKNLNSIIDKLKVFAKVDDDNKSDETKNDKSNETKDDKGAK